MILFIFQIFATFDRLFRQNRPVQPVQQPVQQPQQQALQQPQQQTTNSSNTNAYFRVVDALRPTVNFIFGSRPSHRQGLPLR